MDQRILERIARQDGPLQSLTREELELERAPFTRDPQPKQVRAWVRFGETAVTVDRGVQLDGACCRDSLYGDRPGVQYVGVVLRRQRGSAAHEAATAEQAGLTVLHLDKDFELIAVITGQPCESLGTPAV